MANEDIQFRVGLDASPFEKGLNDTRTITERLKDNISSGFNKVEESIHGMHKAWHKTIHSIAEESPLVANALRIAFSPVTGTLLAAITIFKAVHSHLEEMEKDADNLGDIASKSIGNMREAIKKAKEVIETQQAKFDEWVASHHHAGEEVEAQLKRQLDLLKAQQTILDNILEREKKRMIQEVQSRPGLTPEQRTAELARINQGFSSVSQITRFGTLQAELRAKQTAQTGLQRQQGAAGNEIAGLKWLQSKLPKAEMEDVAEQLKGLEETQRRYEEAIKKAEEKAGQEKAYSEKPLLTGDESMFGPGGLAPSGEAPADTLSNLKSLLERTKKNIEELRTRHEQYTKNSASVAKRLEKAQSMFDALGGQIRTNAEGINQDQLRGSELLSAMDPEAAHIAMQRAAYEKFLSDRAAIFRQFGMYIDRRTGRAVNAFGQGPDMNTATGRDFTRSMQAATGEYATALRQVDRQQQTNIQTTADAVKAIHQILQNVINQP